MKRIVILISTLILSISCTGQDTIVLQSPDNDLSLLLGSRNNRLQLSLLSQSDTLLSESPIGLKINHVDFTRNVGISELSRSAHDTTWHAVINKNPVVRNRYKQVTQYQF